MKFLVEVISGNEIRLVYVILQKLFLLQRQKMWPGNYFKSF